MKKTKLNLITRKIEQTKTFVCTFKVLELFKLYRVKTFPAITSYYNKTDAYIT